MFLCISCLCKMNCFLPSQNLKILAKAIHALSRLPGEHMYVEASGEGLSFRTINSSSSGFMSFLFKPCFFVHWAPADAQNIQVTESQRERNDQDRTTGNYCKISMKSALIFYKNVTRLEQSIESCSISINVNEWLLIFELQCKSVHRRYKLPLLNCGRMYAAFDKTTAKNAISTPGKLFVDGMQQNFHSAQDEVTMCVEEAELQFRNYVDNAPQPEKVLKTELRLERSEFEQYRVQTIADITFCLKELRALLGFVELYQLPVFIRFDEPGRPIVFSLESDPAFIADLVLASFVEADVSQQRVSRRETNIVGAEQPQPEENAPQGIPKHPEGSEATDGGLEEAVMDVEQCQDNGTEAAAVSSIATNGIHSTLGDEQQSLRSQPAPIGSEPLHQCENISQNSPMDSRTPELQDESLMEVEPMQRENGAEENRAAYSSLFRNWSQSTSDSASQQPSQRHQSASRVILAPDSDLEDY